MCRCASLLPTPRDPECRNSQTRSSWSRLTSMKWLPEPRLQAPVRRDRLRALRAVPQLQDLDPAGGLGAVEGLVVLSRRQRDGPLDPLAKRRQIAAALHVPGGELGAHGDHSAADINPDRGRNYRAESRDHRADGRALAECASGISATCGKTNGMAAVRCACSRVLSSRIDAQFISLLLICSTATSLPWHAHRSQSISARAPGFRPGPAAPRHRGRMISGPLSIRAGAGRR
jgi:hypothetical protein